MEKSSYTIINDSHITLQNRNNCVTIDTSQPDEIRKYLQLLFPRDGCIDIRVFTKDGELSLRKFFSTNEKDQAVDFIHQYKENHHVFVGVAARKDDSSGTRDNLAYVRAVWVDIDCEKEGKSKEKVVRELREWNSPPTIIVDSGHGIHAYWILEEPANNFDCIEEINLGLAKALHGDRAVVDAARVMRVPGTHNVKTEPIPVRIIEMNDYKYSLSDFDEYREKIARYDTSTRLTAERQFPDEIVDKVIEECAFLKHCKEDAKELPEPDWHAMITNLLALGAVEKIHELSKPYNKPPHRYSREETQKKIEYALKNDYGPHTCKRIQDYLGFQCPENCPWKEEVKAPCGIAWKIVSSEIALPFKVLGYTSEMKVILWKDGKLIQIPADRLRPNVLMLLVGNLKDKQYKNVKNAILSKAYEKGIVDVNKAYKSGIWKVEDGFLIISGQDILHVIGSKITRIQEPIWSRKILNLGDEPWINPEKLEDCLQTVRIEDTFEKLKNLISQWAFADGEVIPYLTAFVMLSPFQHAMQWRPWVYITGKRGTGKTTFFQEVLGILRGLVIRMDKTTAHALAQEIGCTGRIPVLDEFEKYRKLEEILELAKLANAGGNYTRGTTGEKMKKWSLHHMFWFGSIYPAGNDAAQRSRTVFFELLPHGDNKPKFLSLAEKEELKHEIIASMLKKWSEIEQKASEYWEKKNEYKVKDGRVIDNIAYAAALVDIATGEGGIPEFAKQIDFEEDEERILRTILMSFPPSHFSVDRGITVIEYLESGNNDIAKLGVKKFKRRNGKTFLAIDPERVKEELLKERWQDLDITAPLLRLAESRRKEPVNMGKNATVRAVLIPWETVQRIMGKQDDDQNEREDIDFFEKISVTNN